MVVITTASATKQGNTVHQLHNNENAPMRFVALRRAEAAVAVGAEIGVVSEECATRDVRNGSVLRLSVRWQPQFDFQTVALSTSLVCVS